MGLCKCPKRKVTNLFCYEHRVNVCQNCMVKNHPKCVVQSYLCWLQDSDYNPICLLCNKDLAADDCIRLICYHVFHWACLDRYARQLPETTAPAGYACPACKEPIFPKPKLASAVAEVLREKIASVNWARAGLGLPLLTEDGEVKPISDNILIPNLYNGNGVPIQNHANITTGDNIDIIVHMEDATNTFNRSELPDLHPCAIQTPRRPFHGLDNSINTFIDDDDNKYRRRTPSDWFQRWSKSIMSKVKFYRGPRRPWLLLIFVLILIGFIILISSSLGHGISPDETPMNTHVRDS